MKSFSLSYAARFCGLALAAGLACAVSTPLGCADSAGPDSSESTGTAGGSEGGHGPTSASSGGASSVSSSSGSGASSSSTNSGGSSSSSQTSTSSSTGTGAGGGGTCNGAIGTADYPAEMELNDSQAMSNLIAPGTKGFSGQLCPFGDVDVFQIDVEAGAALTARVTLDGTGCPVANKMQLRLLDSHFINVVTDSHATGPCPALTPDHYPVVQTLAAGTYYLEVRNLSTHALDAYQLDASAASPSCGDTVASVDIGEQCDDGNPDDGDGCSMTCQLETGSYTNEVEPNDTAATATPVDGFDGAVGAVNPASDQDNYSVTVTTAGSSIVARISDGLGNCPSAGWNPELKLIDANGTTVLATDHNSDPSGCPLIAPSKYATAGNLAPGVYTVRVRDRNGSAIKHLYVVEIHALAPGCGDTVIQAGEQCDDGNQSDGDGCSSACQFEHTYIQETEPNDDVAQANALGAADGFFASISSALDKDAFRFDVTAPGESVVITLDDGQGGCPNNLNARLRLFSPGGTTLTDVTGPHGSGPCVIVNPGNTPGAANLPLGTYIVYVEPQGAQQVPQYILQIKVQPPGCGDGLLQAGEQCDDGNSTSSDGCSATCTAEAPNEVEPNPTRATATPLWPGTSSWVAAINPVGDIDVFVFDLPMPGPVTVLTHAVGSTTSCGFDTQIGIFDAAGTSLAVDDNGGIGNCSKIAPGNYPAVANLPAGTYYVAVTQTTNTTVIPKYALDVILP